MNIKKPLTHRHSISEFKASLKMENNSDFNSTGGFKVDTDSPSSVNCGC